MGYFGVDYYPEHWPIEQMETDLKGISDMGSNIIRIGEFAWHLMETSDGNFDFTFFDQVIEKAQKYGLEVMFGTPTATFPAWLAHEHSSILSIDEFGNKRAFGGRRQYCFNSRIYQKYSERITQKLVSHYADEKGIIVWQVDNEFGHEGSDQCYCDNCKVGFQEYLKEKYEEIGHLNESWGTIFWGQTYNDFKEIPVPKPTITTHNPGLKLDWARFRSVSVNRFAHKMTEIIQDNKGDHQAVTTNVTGGFFDKWFNHEEHIKPMDFVSYDNYPVWGGLEKPISPANIGMTLDFNRGLKNQNFWIVEELMGAQGHDVIGYLPRPNQAKMWSYQAFAHGCSNLLYFRWRAMTRGAEQFCYGVVDHDNKYGRKYEEVKEVFHEIRDYEKLLDAPINSEIAIIYDYENIWAWRSQIQSKDFNFTNELLRLYQPFYDMNASIDVIPYDRDFWTYKVILVPVMQIMEPELANRLKKFTKNGGTVIFSFRTGLKDKTNAIRLGESLPGPVSDLTGIKIVEIESLTTESVLPVKGNHSLANETSHISIWRDIIIPDTAEVIYKYTDKFYSEFAAVTKNSFGNGTAYYVGGGIEVDGLSKIAENILQSHKIDFVRSPQDVEVCFRKYNGQVSKFVMNHSDENKIFEGVKLEPFQSLIMSNEEI